MRVGFALVPEHRSEALRPKLPDPFQHSVEQFARGFPLAIARLLLKAPDIVVLDEATAHLDSESEVAVQRALKKVLAGRTSIVIAHRLSTVRDADQILVVDAGHIVERGRHTELLLAGGLYAELYNTQFAEQATGEEELGPVEDVMAEERPQTSPG